MDLSTTPAMAPPDGQTPRFDAPYDSLQIRTVVAFGISYFFASVFLALRYFQAFKLVKQVEIDLSKLRLLVQQHWISDAYANSPVCSYPYDCLWPFYVLFYNVGQLYVLSLGTIQKAPS